jgi:hypothetical protein
MLAGSTSTTRMAHGASSWRSESARGGEGGLGRVERAGERRVEPDADRADDHYPAGRPAQQRQHRLGDRELAGHVDVQLPPERIQRHQLGRAGQAVPGVVDQAVQPGGGVPADHRGRLGDLARLGDVEQHRGDLAAGRGAGQLVTVGFPPDPGVDVPPGGREAQRGGLPDARGGTGDESVLARAVHGSSVSRSCVS